MNKGFSVELTDAQYAEVSVAYDHYKREWKRQVKNFLKAFLQANKLTRPLSEQEQQETPIMTPEEAADIRQMFSLMRQIKSSTPLKQLEG
jgi:hypothetical protein